MDQFCDSLLSYLALFLLSLLLRHKTQTHSLVKSFPATFLMSKVCLSPYPVPSLSVWDEGASLPSKRLLNRPRMFLIARVSPSDHVAEPGEHGAGGSAAAACDCPDTRPAAIPSYAASHRITHSPAHHHTITPSHQTPSQPSLPSCSWAMHSSLSLTTRARHTQ